jgi:hypothetical protein
MPIGVSCKNLGNAPYDTGSVGKSILSIFQSVALGALWFRAQGIPDMSGVRGEYPAT